MSRAVFPGVVSDRIGRKNTCCLLIKSLRKSAFMSKQELAPEHALQHENRIGRNVDAAACGAFATGGALARLGVDIPFLSGVRIALSRMSTLFRKSCRS
jgi:hypothetical protein